MVDYAFIKFQNQAAIISILLVPRASSNRICGVHGDRLKIAVTAPPVDGEANAEIERFLAKLLGISPSQVSIVRGHKSKRKDVCLQISRELLCAKLGRALSGGD